MIAFAGVTGPGPAIVLFLGVAALTLLGVWLLGSGSDRRSTLMTRGGLDRDRRRRLTARIEARLLRTARGERLAGRLRSAGIQLGVFRYLMLNVAAALAAFAVGSLLFPTVFGLLAAALALWGVAAWLQRRLGKRKEEFIVQLPEIARLLSNGSSAGLSMPAAIELTVREIDVPARDELQTVIDEMRLGRTLEESLESLKARLPSREIGVLMTTLVIQQRAGGDVVRALQDLSETLDGRRETLREVRTLMSGAMMTSYLVPALGAGALLLLNTVNSDTLNRMTSNPIGIVLLIVAGILYALGAVGIRRVARIDL